MAAPERILFALDLDAEIGSRDLQWSPNAPFLTRWNILTSLLRAFVGAKTSLNPKHSFGLAGLSDSALMLTDGFVSSTAFVTALSTIKPASSSFASFDAASLWQLTAGLDPPRPEAPVRIIAVWSRSSVPLHPPAPPTAEFRAFVKSPAAWFDALYLHAKPQPGTDPQTIYDEIVGFEPHLIPHKTPPYFFEAATSARKVALALSTLLAHPAQRRRQSDQVTRQPLPA